MLLFFYWFNDMQFLRIKLFKYKLLEKTHSTVQPPITYSQVCVFFHQTPTAQEQQYRARFGYSIFTKKCLKARKYLQYHRLHIRGVFTQRNSSLVQSTVRVLSSGPLTLIRKCTKRCVKYPTQIDENGFVKKRVRVESVLYSPNCFVTNNNMVVLYYHSRSHYNRLGRNGLTSVLKANSYFHANLCFFQEM